MSVPDWISAISTALAAVLAGVALRQAHRAYKIALRPRLIVSHFVFPIEDCSAQAFCIVGNTGGDIAHIEEINAEVIVTDGRLPARPPHWDRTKNKFVPKDNTPMADSGIRDLLAPYHPGRDQAYVIDVAKPLSSNNVMEIGSGRSAVFIIGFVRYKSDYGLIYWTHFCRKYDPVLNSFCRVQTDWDNIT